MALNSKQVTQINDMCPVSDLYSVGSRIKYLSENGNIIEIVSTAAKVSTAGDNPAYGVLYATGSDKVYDIAQPSEAGQKVTIISRIPTSTSAHKQYIRLSTDGSITEIRSTKYNVITLATGSKDTLELVSLSSAKWAALIGATGDVASLSSST